MSYDTKCYELARYFMEYYPAHPETRNAMAEELAQRIQDVIEDYFKLQDVIDRIAK